MRKPQILRAPDDESGSSDADSGDKRKRVSERLFLDAAGEAADGINIDSAANARYVLLDEEAGNHNIDYIYGENPDLDRKFAMFGFHTKIGNVANTVLNDKDEPGTPSDAAGAIKDWMAQAGQGTWAEPRTGGPGVRIDKDALAGAIVECAAAGGATVDYQKVRDRLESDRVYVRDARQVPEVAQAYARRVGKATKTVADLIG